MIVDYNIEELENALSDFYNATGSAIILLDSDFNTIVGLKNLKNPFCELVQTNACGKERCRLSDECIINKCVKSKNLEMHTCHAGLIDVAVPINFNNSVIGYIVLGQMRTKATSKEVFNRISDLNLDYETVEQVYNSLPVSSEERIKSVSNIAAMLTQYILFKNMITNRQNNIINCAVMYISANINKDLSIAKICEELSVSKNALYRAFNKYMNCTVGEYIGLKRIELAKTLVLNSDKDLQSIAEEVGFSDYAYFSKVFKKLVGISPLKYKKSNDRK